MARRIKPIDTNKLELYSPLLKYRITRHGEDPIYVEATEVSSWAEGTLMLSIEYTGGYTVQVCGYAKDEWEKIELVSAFPEET